MDITEPELPRALALAWGVAARPQRGPKRELDIDRIVDVAVTLADVGGLSAVSMASVAAELGVTSMALYRYVDAKDDLMLLMQERGIGVPPPSVRESPDWRTGIERWNQAMAQVYLSHLWLLDIPIEGTPTTPNNLAWLETALDVLRDVPLSDSHKVAVTLALIAQVRWEAHIIRGYIMAAAAAGGETDAVDHRAEEILRRLVSAEQFPHVRGALDAGVFSEESDPFAFGRARVLDGVEEFIARTAGDKPEKRS